MRTTVPFTLIYWLVTSFTNAFAGPFCDQFSSTSESKQGQYILSVVDEQLSKWPQNQKMKTMMSDAERLSTMFADAHRKMAIACNAGNDFAAGMALGEDLAVYKMALLELQ